MYVSQGLQRICISAKLNEVAAHYSQEGWDHFYLAVAGTNCEILLNMFSELLGPPQMLDPTELESPATKKAHTEVGKFEEEMLKCEGLPDTSKETILYPTSFSIPTDFYIEKEFCPTIGYAEEKSKASGKMVTKSYYNCTICDKKSQNEDSMLNHSRPHLNIFLGCTLPKCGKKYKAPDSLKDHITKKHSRLLLPTTLSKDGAEAMVAKLSSAK